MTGLGLKEMPTFHGGSEKGGVDPIEFIADFEQHAQLHRWDEQTKVGAFQQALKGARGRTWQRERQKRVEARKVKSSWLAWKRAFLKELREPDYEDRLLNRWLECRQQGDESVLKYMQRYETAVYRVKDVGAIQSDRFEAQKVSRFIEGLRMRYRAQVSSSRPRSLEAAFTGYPGATG